MGRPSDDQSINADHARRMMNNKNVCKGDLLYIIEHVSGVGADEVRAEAQKRIPTTPSFGERLQTA